MSDFLVAALYKFVSLDDFGALQTPLRRCCEEADVLGTLLLASEGINGTIAGREGGVRDVLAWLRSDPRLADLTHKESWSEEQPFGALKVRRKREIVSLRVPGVDPCETVGTYVAPRDWNALITRPDVVLIDARNDYETELGTFTGAIDPETASFGDLPAWLASQDLPADTPIAMFCTGGIRCEKATSYLKSQGFNHVFHLEGGILRYLEEVKQADSLWKGECFVFDRRVTVGHDLRRGTHVFCAVCGRGVSVADAATHDRRCRHCRPVGP